MKRLFVGLPFTVAVFSSWFLVLSFVHRLRVSRKIPEMGLGAIGTPLPVFAYVLILKGLKVLRSFVFIHFCKY